ncbi:MAG: hypothetical protein IPK15_10490 [Verrucomicrobia bacterium]|nr:hypothetical protein [Verrucomicrobiota bacterium]
MHNATPFGDVFMGTRLDGVIVTNIVAVGGLVINEVLADNASGVTVEGGRRTGSNSSIPRRHPWMSAA